MKSTENDWSQSQDIQILQRKRRTEDLLRDLAILGFLACIFAGGGFIAASGKEYLPEGCVMYLVMGMGIILAAYHFQYIAIAVASLQTFFYIVYKLYMVLAMGKAVGWVTYGWLVLPLLCIFFAITALKIFYRSEAEMKKMEKQIKDMVLLEPVTGFYNVKSMYVDIERQIAFSRRNNLPFSLMIIELRYPQELQSILNAVQFDLLKKRLAEYIEDRIRLEDRIYAVDDKGSLGVICTCDREGTEVIKGRIKSGLLQNNLFEGIAEKAVRIEIKIGCYGYDESIKSAMELKKKAENELQYDV